MYKVFFNLGSKGRAILIPSFYLLSINSNLHLGVGGALHVRPKVVSHVSSIVLTKNVGGKKSRDRAI